MIALKSLASGSHDDLFKEFGFDSKKATFEAERYLGKPMKPRKNSEVTQSRLDRPPVMTENPFAQDLTDLSANDAADFFSQLGSAPKPEPEKPKKEELSVEKNASQEFMANTNPNHLLQETVSRNANWNEGHENLIKKNLMIGNLQYAAEVALKCGRTTAALLIAERGGPDLYEDIKQRYFELEKDTFVTSVIQPINNRDLSTLTNAENLRIAAGQPDGIPQATNWKENIAYLMSYFEGSVNERNQIIKEMGDVLLEQREISAAIVCYILSKHVSEVLNIWKRRAIHHIQRKEATREDALADLLKKIILMKLALESCNTPVSVITSNEDFNQILAEVGNYLTSDERAAISCMKYLSMSSPNSSLEVEMLKERLYQAHIVAMTGIVQPP